MPVLSYGGWLVGPINYSIVPTFGNLQNNALGQTTGKGPSAAITLDTTAAGRGWYIDATPLDNLDDYLPTSNPNIWQAKAGCEAAGKMDMRSVLLHEYGTPWAWSTERTAATTWPLPCSPVNAACESNRKAFF